MASSERLIMDVAQLAADGIDHTDRVFRARCELSDARAGVRLAVAESRELLTEIDAILAKGGKALIEAYYRAPRKNLVRGVCRSGVGRIRQKRSMLGVRDSAQRASTGREK
jgi:hypothetical protein